MSYKEFYEFPILNQDTDSVVSLNEDEFTALYNSGIFSRLNRIFGTYLEYSEEGEFTAKSGSLKDFSVITRFLEEMPVDDTKDVATRIVNMIATYHDIGRNVYYMF